MPKEKTVEPSEKLCQKCQIKEADDEPAAMRRSETIGRRSTPELR